MGDRTILMTEGLGCSSVTRAIVSGEARLLVGTRGFGRPIQ